MVNISSMGTFSITPVGENFIAKSLMANTINAKGVGKTHDLAIKSLQINIRNLYPECDYAKENPLEISGDTK